MIKFLILPLPFIIISLTSAINLFGQEFMPQGTFVQTCSPVIGEKYIFEGQAFKFYSDDMKVFGQGVYGIKNNRITFDFSEQQQFPVYQISTGKLIVPGDKKSIKLKVYAPGGYKNQVGINIEVQDNSGLIIHRTDAPITDSIDFFIEPLIQNAILKILHPTEGEIKIPLDFSMHSEILAEVYFQNNWEEITEGTRYRFKIQNIRTSSFLLEKVLVKKSYYCVFVRIDQAMKLLEQLKSTVNAGKQN
jgi:hypothetical protein